MIKRRINEFAQTGIPALAKSAIRGVETLVFSLTTGKIQILNVATAPRQPVSGSLGSLSE